MSGLYGTDKRLPKNNPIYDALGTLDELNALLGMCRARFSRGNEEMLEIASILLSVQECLFIAQAEIAGADGSIKAERTEELERLITNIESSVGNPNAFVIPGATENGGLLDYARALSRRAERAVLAAHALREVSPGTRIYLNRLSSLLYALARYAVKCEGTEEASPSY